MGTTTETLKIVNEIVYKGKEKARQIKDDLGKVDGQITITNESLAKMGVALGAAGVALGAAGVAASKFYDTIKAGAQVQAAATTFDALTASIGSTANAMLGELQMATGGMISDLDLMQAASQFAAMGLANNSAEASKLANVASTLGAAFRGDAVAGMEEFSLLLANTSIPRLDSFGISAGRVRERIADLQAETPGLSREAAFMEAVMAEAEITMGKLGDESAEAAVQIGILEANAKNAKDQFVAATAEGAIPFVSALNQLNDALGLTESNMSLTEQAVTGFLAPLTGFIESTATITQALRNNSLLDVLGFQDANNLRILGEARAELTAVNEEIETMVSGPGNSALGIYGGVTSQITELVEATAEVNDEWRESVRQSQIVASQQQGLNHAMDQGVGFVGDTREGWVTYNDTLEDTVEIIDRNAQRQRILSQNMALADEAQRQLNASLGDYFVQISTAENFTFDVNQELYNLVDAGDASAETMAGLASALGLMSSEEAEAFLRTTVLRGELMELAQAVIDGDVSMDDAAAAARGLSDGLFATTDEALRAAEAARILKSDLDKIPTSITVDIDVNTGGALVNQGTGGPSISEFATGTPFAPGGMAMVGEYGPEMVHLPRGAQVISTNQTHNNTNTTNINGASGRGQYMLLEALRRSTRMATITG